MPRIIPNERIARTIFVLRGQRVLLDTELAALYGVTTKRLNEQVKRNGKRFPPFAFTEHGAIMAATILNSALAVEMSVYVVRAFVRLRELMNSPAPKRRGIGFTANLSEKT